MYSDSQTLKSAAALFPGEANALVSVLEFEEATAIVQSEMCWSGRMKPVSNVRSEGGKTIIGPVAAEISANVHWNKDGTWFFPSFPTFL